MNPELIGLYIGLGLTLIGMIAGLVNERIRTATSMALMDQAIKVLQKNHEDHTEWNKGQHAELYQSRNNMSDVLSRLTALFESMDKKQDSMDRKLDTLLERRSTER